MSLLDDVLSIDYTANIEEKTSKGFKNDERIWVVKDGNKNCSLVGRFVPVPGEPIPYLNMNTHTIEYIDGDGKPVKFKHFCMKAVDGSNCPTCNKSWEIWGQKDKTEDMKDFGYSLKAKEMILVNFKIDSDSQNPENNGKVVLLPLNGLVIDTFMDAAAPKKEVTEKASFKPKGVFHPLKAAKVIVEFESSHVTGEKYNKWELVFDTSEMGPLAKTKEEIEEILGSAYKMTDLINEYSTGELKYYGAMFQSAGAIAENLKKAVEQQSEDSDYEDDGYGDYDARDEVLDEPAEDDDLNIPDTTTVTQEPETDEDETEDTPVEESITDTNTTGEIDEDFLKSMGIQ